MNEKDFYSIKKKLGYCGSWAIWSEVKDTPKSNMGDLSLLDPSINKNLLNEVNPNIIFVALNFSRETVMEEFANFHDGRHISQDYKIRYALKGTKLWGGYMTDIIKNFPEKSSSKMMSFLKKDKKLEIENCQIFTEELSLLKSHQPKIIAFGNDAFSILQRNFKNKFDIVKVPHYANYINKEKYRELLISLCKNVNV
jgi:hypothetical protein